MNFNLKKPCKNCPFRVDSLKGWLGGKRSKEIIKNIAAEDKTFSCHKTIDYDTEPDENGVSEPRHTRKTEHCAGALILLEKQDKPNQMMRIAERLGLYDYTKLDMSSPIFNTNQEFIKHHSKY